MKSKLLIFIPSPRDIIQFHNAIDDIPHDKLWKKYMPYSMDPYGQAYDYFIQHKEYTHFAICPDDLIVNKAGVDRLWVDAQKYDVISGICNVDLKDLQRGEDMNIAVTSNLPTLHRAKRKYNWFQKKDLMKDAIMQVPWCGTPFMILSRKVMAQIKLEGDGKANNDTGFSYDVGIANALAKIGIKQYVDTGVFFVHLRIALRKYLHLGEPDTWLDIVGQDRVFFSGNEYVPNMLDPMDMKPEPPNWLGKKDPPRPCPLTKKKHDFALRSGDIVYCRCGTVKT